MNPLVLARWQFGITTVYHFFFVPLTLGLSILVALMETLYVRTGDETYRRMTRFWGKLFLINFAMGVATGIVQEFQFGMNWSEYARFVGDIFGAPLAIEALLAFFLESTFLGVWIFGWDVLPKKVHAAAIWLVAIGSNISALWILIANSFMQQPVGYVLRNGRAEMTDFFALIGNPNVWVQFPHVLFSGLLTAAFFILGISAYRLLRTAEHSEPSASYGLSDGDDLPVFRRSAQMAVVTAVLAAVLVILNGHTQTQHMVQIQPMKLAAAEALWESENPASFSLITIGNEPERRDVFAIRLPAVLSILAYNRPTGEVKGIKNLQAEYEQKYGPGDYVPPVAVTYWVFRMMVGSGMLMAGIAFLALYFMLRGRPTRERAASGGWRVLREQPIGGLPQVPARLLRLLPLAIALPYLANTCGWLMAELGRQPWAVFGVMRTADAVSQVVGGGAVLFTLLAFTLLYAVLMAADVYLLAKFSRGPVQAVDVSLGPVEKRE